MSAESVIATLSAEIQSWVERNIIGAQPLSFEMYQDLAVFLWHVDKNEVKSVYHKLSDRHDPDALVFDVVLNRPIEYVTVTYKIEGQEGE